jgi:hypothetical protein
VHEAPIGAGFPALHGAVFSFSGVLFIIDLILANKRPIRKNRPLIFLEVFYLFSIFTATDRAIFIKSVKFV